MKIKYIFIFCLLVFAVSFGSILLYGQGEIKTNSKLPGKLHYKSSGLIEKKSLESETSKVDALGQISSGNQAIPQSPTFKKTNHNRESNPVAVHVPPGNRASQSPSEKRNSTESAIVNPKHFGATGNGITDDSSALQTMLNHIKAREVTVEFPPGTYVINRDLTFPANIHVVLPKGAKLSPGVVPGSVILTNSDINPAAGEQIAYNSTTGRVTGTGTGFIVGNARNLKIWPGSYITNISLGERKQVKHLDSDGVLYLVSPFSQSFSATHHWKRSSLDVQTTNTSGLEVGDFLYVGGNTHIIGLVQNATTIKIVSHLPATFSTSSWTRGARVKLLGAFESGNYQVFTGNGVVKFGQGAVQYVRPEWWGAKCGREEGLATANDNAIEKAMHSCQIGGDPSPKGAQVQFSTGTYRLNRAIVLPPGTFLVGAAPAVGGFCTGTTLGWVSHYTPSDCPVSLIMDCDNYNYSHFFVPFGLINLNISTGSQSANYTHSFCGSYRTKFLEIRDCNFVGSPGGWGDYQIYLNGSADVKIVGNRITGENGIYLYGYDSICTGNNLNVGRNYAQNGQFTDTKAWTLGTGWQIASGPAAPGPSKGRAVAVNATGTLKQAVNPIAHPGGHRYAVWFTLENVTRGSVTVSLGGVSGSPRSGVPSGKKAYCEEIVLQEPPANPDLIFTPAGGFTGKIADVLLCSGNGIYIPGGGPIIADNMIYGDPGSYAGIEIRGTKVNGIVNNQLFAHHVGLLISGPVSDTNIVANRIRGNRKHGIYCPATGSLWRCTITSNSINDNGYFDRDTRWHDAVEGCYGIYYRGGASGSIIKNNSLHHNYSGPVYLDWGSGPGLLCEDNIGVDLQVPSLPALDNTTSAPRVGEGKFFTTNATTPRSVNRLRQGCVGKDLCIALGDTHTILKEFGSAAGIYTFSRASGWSGNLNGAAAWDYFPHGAKLAVNDAVYFGGVWSDAERFGAVQVHVGTPWKGTGTLQWQYWNGASWQPLTTSAANIFANTGTQTMTFTPLPDWALGNLEKQLGRSAPKSNGYWIRCIVTAVGSHTAGGANASSAAGISYLRLNGDFGPVTAGRTGMIHLKEANGLWYEVSRMIR